MTGLRTVLARCRARLPSGDRGTTLMELIVGMAVMTIFMAMFTGAVVAMTRTTSRVEAVITASSQLEQSFLKLGKVVRYAAAISPPGVSSTSGDWYVELASDTDADADPGAGTCTQLRIDNQDLQMRSWPAGTTPPAQFDGTTIATNITLAAPATAPFTVPPVAPGTNTPFQRLQITLAAPAGGSSTTPSQMTFSALNSSSAAVNSAVCQSQSASTRP